MHAEGVINGTRGIEADPKLIAFIFLQGDVFPSLVDYDVKIEGTPIENGFDSPILVSYKAIFA